ncbi:hypothetical protein AwErysi_07120 [Erysipelotrichaceae bacterium]|nr:hypothetical protein AwErysi_07120 [Erysipelotrichaceae bacterium]
MGQKKLYLNPDFLRFLQLLSQISEIGSIKKLAYRLQIPRRKIYYQLADLNAFLEAEGISAIVSDGEKISVSSGQRTSIEEILANKETHAYIYLPAERQIILALNLLSAHQPLYLHNIITYMEVSRNTVIADVKKVRTLLLHLHHDAILKSRKDDGYYLEMQEFDRRKVMHQLIAQLITFKRNLSKGYIENILWNAQVELHEGIITRDILIEIDRVIENIAVILGKSLSFQDGEIFRASIFLLLLRMNSKLVVEWDQEEKVILEQFVEFQAALEVLKALNTILEVKLEENEAYFLAVLLLGARKDVDGHNQSDNFTTIRHAVQLMIEKFELHAGVRFEGKQTLEEQLITHIKALFYRTRYGLNIENALTHNVMERYPDIFRITKEASIYLEKYLDLVVNDDEIAYLAVHFGSYLMRNNKRVQQQKIILVSNLGIGVSGIFFQQIQQILPEFTIIDIMTTEQAAKLEEAVQFCITTELHYNHHQGQTVLVHAILSESDVWRLFSICKNDMSDENYPKIEKRLLKVFKEYGIDVRNVTPACIRAIFSTLHEHENMAGEIVEKKLSHYLQQRYIFHEKEIVTLDTAIDILAAPLIKNGNIEKSYTQIIKQELTTNILANTIATGCLLLHHHYKSGSQIQGISAIYIENGIELAYEEKGQHLEAKIYIIFLVATAEDMSHIPLIFSIDQWVKNGGMVRSNAQKKLSF